MPVSNSTKPSPERTAHALQCGTPGHGSGSRRRKTPGWTRSPRPSSRLRSARAGACAELRLPASATPRRLDYGACSVPEASEERGMPEQDDETASKAATKVQEAAANVRQARSGRKRITKSSAESVAL